MRDQRRFDFLLLAADLAHGVVKGQAEHAHEEVNGVAGEIAFGPAPVTVFDDQAGISGQGKVARLAWEELHPVFFEQGHERCQAGGADLFTRPARLRGAGCHSLFANGVG